MRYTHRLPPRDAQEVTVTAGLGAGPRSVPSLLADWGKLAGRLFVTLTPELILVVLVLGAARAWLFPLAGAGVPFGVLTVVGLAVAGTLFVIPTAGEVPIVQSLLMYGVAPGLAGSLLLTLPAVSLPSLLMMRRACSARLLVLVATIVACLGVAAGFVAQIFL
jgi:uncharacterized protein